MRVIEHQPPQAVELRGAELSLFFAGPIQGAPDWQTEGIKIVENFPDDQEIHIYNPRREYLGEKFDKKKQIRWEKAGLARSAFRAKAQKRGGIVFWLAQRDFNLPYKEGRSYAQTTRVEFGRAGGWKDSDPDVNISLGIEPGYEGSVDYYTDTAEEFGLPIFTSLEETCINALNLILDKK